MLKYWLNLFRCLFVREKLFPKYLIPEKIQSFPSHYSTFTYLCWSNVSLEPHLKSEIKNSVEGYLLPTPRLSTLILEKTVFDSSNFFGIVIQHFYTMVRLCTHPTLMTLVSCFILLSHISFSQQ